MDFCEKPNERQLFFRSPEYSHLDKKKINVLNMQMNKTGVREINSFFSYSGFIQYDTGKSLRGQIEYNFTSLYHQLLTRGLYGF